MNIFTATTLGATIRVVWIDGGCRVEKSLDDQPQILTSSPIFYGATGPAQATKLAMKWLSEWVDSDDDLTSKNLDSDGIPV